MRHPQIYDIMKFYDELVDTEGYEWVRWSNSRRRFTEKSANRFFIGVMLDQGQKAERAWDGAAHLVDNYFNKGSNFWEDVANTHHATVKKICQKGYDGKSYATNFTFNVFPKRLRSAANIIIKDYESDVRNIWNVTPMNVNLIYERFIGFDGIGDALAKMAQFILVRNYGVAGGENNQHLMSIKPDILVQRVIYRSGLAQKMSAKEVSDVVNGFSLKSPADFDASAWIIGREYCLKSNPRCEGVPNQWFVSLQQ